MSEGIFTGKGSKDKSQEEAISSSYKDRLSARHFCGLTNSDSKISIMGRYTESLLRTASDRNQARFV